MTLPKGDLTMTPGNALDVFLRRRFPGARINRGLERVLNTTKTGANSIDWLMAMKVVMEDRARWAVNTFMPYKAPGPDGIYPLCSQKT